uniref:Phosphatidylinositol-specific phospholipase C X domain-containing protein n=1 Tax=viral metagenome TaxID=1070528 RepID=A0A6C0JIN9_9ZZZZ
METRTSQTIEPFDLGVYTDPAKAELNKLIDKKIKLNMQSIQPQYADLPLKEYCIKASYNSAYTGTFMNYDMLTYLLSRGVRFFDLEVYYVKDPKTGEYSPQVGYSTDGKFITMDSKNTLLLDNVLSTLVAGAFSQTSPTYDDPLFINLRIRSNNTDIYKAVAASVDFTLKPKLYKNSNGSRKVTKNTLMSKLLGTVVLLVDKTIDRDYRSYCACTDAKQTCYDLTKYINMESGSEDMNLNRYTDILAQNNVPIKIMNDNLRTDIQYMNLVLPNVLPENASNPAIMTFITSYGIEIIPFKFYQRDEGLLEYENFFNENNASLIPLARGLAYFQKMMRLQNGG